MKILIISNLYFPNEIGGYEIGCKDFKNILNEMGHEVIVATSMNNFKKKKDFSVKKIFKCFVNYNIATKTYSYNEVEKYNPRKLEKIINEFKPDKILVWNIQGLGLKIIKKIIESNIFFRIFCWDYTYFSYKKRLRDYIFFRFKNKISGFVYNKIINKMIFPSKFLSNYYLGKNQKPKVIYPFVEYKNFSFKSKFSKKKNKLVYVGQSVIHKGIFNIINYIIKFNLENKIKLELTIYSKNFPIETFKNIKKYNFFYIKKNIKRSQIQKELSDYDIGIFPSMWDEPFGISQLEMLASGLTVLSSGTGGSKEMVIKNNPIIFDVSNYNSFRDQILSILYSSKKSNWLLWGKKKFSKLTTIKRLNNLLFNTKISV